VGGRVVLSVFVVFMTRALLVMLFLPFSALDKILNFKQAVEQASEIIPVRSLAKMLIFCGFGTEVVMSLAILTGITDRLAALFLAGYCIVTAILWKQFWRKQDFRLEGNSRGRDVFWDFLKNLAIAGGFLLLAFGTDPAGIKRFVADPLGSSHPYTLVDRSGS
jgi:putative oxidoreductase